MASKLVMLDGTKVITGDELKHDLEDMGFGIPDVAPAAVYVSPQRVTLLPNDPGYKAAVAVRRAAMIEAYANYLADLRRRDAEVLAIADMLRGMFEIATDVIVGLNPDGTKKREWQVIPTVYTYEQAAGRLAGIYTPKPTNVINFICYESFR